MDSAQDTRTGQVRACDESFFSALLAADHQTLTTILADSFVIVMSGQAAHREDLLDAISSGELQFADVRQYTEERSVRHRNSLAVVIGQTRGHRRTHGAATISAVTEEPRHQRRTPRSALGIRRALAAPTRARSAERSLFSRQARPRTLARRPKHQTGESKPPQPPN